MGSIFEEFLPDKLRPPQPEHAAQKGARSLCACLPLAPACALPLPPGPPLLPSARATVAPWQVVLCVSSCALPAQRAPSITLFHSGTRRSVAELAFGIEVVSGGIGNGVDPTAGPSRVGLGSSSVRQRPTSSRPSRTPSSSAAAVAAAAEQQQQGRRRRRRRRQRGGGIEVLQRGRGRAAVARGAAPRRRQGGALAARARADGACRPRGSGAQRGGRRRVRVRDACAARAGRMARRLRVPACMSLVWRRADRPVARSVSG